MLSFQYHISFPVATCQYRSIPIKLYGLDNF